MSPVERVTQRLRQVRESLRGQGMDALLVSPGPDLLYLTGCSLPESERLTCLVVRAEAEPRLVMPRLDAEGAAAALAGSGVELLPWSDGEDAAALVASVLPREGAVAIGDRMRAAHVFALRDAMPGVTQRAAGPLVAALRVCKDDDELAALRAAGAAIDKVHAGMAAWLRVGRTELEVAADVSAAILAAGHSEVGFVIVAAGPAAADSHHRASGHVIAPGELVVVDIAGMMPSGYFSDMTRTYAMGGPPAEAVRVWETLVVAHAAARAAVAPGVPAGEVDRAARDVIAAAGYGDAFVHRTGHGIGLDLHEEPYIVAGDDRPLEPGMTFSVEPGIYLPGRFGMRLEDIVACGPDGAERLNLRPHELVVLEA